MATLIDALAVTLNWNAGVFSQKAASAWQAFAQAAREPGRAFRSMEAGAQRVAAILGWLCSEARALWDFAAADAGLGLRGHVPIEASYPVALTPGGLAETAPFHVDQPAMLANAFMPAGEVETRPKEGDGMFAAASGAAAYPHWRGGAWVAKPARDGDGADRPAPVGTTITNHREERWQDVLLALGSLKILSSTKAVAGIVPALQAACASRAQAGADPLSAGAEPPAEPPLHGRAAAAMALHALSYDAQSVGSPAVSRGQTSGRVVRSTGADVPEQVSKGGLDTAHDAGAWTATRAADFKRTFGVDVSQSTPEQQLGFVDWESRGAAQPAGDAQAGGTTSEPIKVVLSRLLGVEPPAGEMREVRQRTAATAPFYPALIRDAREQGGAAAVVTAMAAQAGTSQTADATLPARSTSETHIHGAITLVTQAVDGPAIARDLAGLGHSQRLIQQGNTGIF